MSNTSRHKKGRFSNISEEPSKTSGRSWHDDEIYIYITQFIKEFFLNFTDACVCEIAYFTATTTARKMFLMILIDNKREARREQIYTYIQEEKKV